MRVPRLLGRILGGEAVVMVTLQAPGVSNAKARRELDWRPQYPSWREGLAAELS